MADNVAQELAKIRKDISKHATGIGVILLIIAGVNIFQAVWLVRIVFGR